MKWQSQFAEVKGTPISMFFSLIYWKLYIYYDASVQKSGDQNSDVFHVENIISVK